MILAIIYYITSFLVSLVNPFWGFVGFICSLILRFQDHYPALVIFKPFTFLFAGMIIGCILNRQTLAKGVWLQDKLLFTLLSISIIGLAILAPGNLIHESYLFICSIAIYYFASRILQTPNQFLILFMFMAACITFSGILVIQDITTLGIKSPYIDPRSGRWQGLGYYKNSNEFGQLMISTLPFLLTVLIISINRILKLIALAMIGIMTFVMIQCASRTVMVILALMLITLFMLRGNGHIIKKMVIGGIIAMALLALLTFMPESLQERMGTVLNANDDASFQGRTRSWGYGFDMLSWYPFTGVGKGQWIEYHGLMPHNSYVQIMAELGIFGIFIFLWILKLSFNNFSEIIKPKTSFSNQSKIIFKPIVKVLAQHPKQVIDRSGSFSQSIAIATLITFSAWLFYIFLGNQGYSVWTYFYIGLCAAIPNFSRKEITKDSTKLFKESSEVGE